MNWTQELCEKFWKGVGATREGFYWRVSNGDRIIGYPNGTWDNPEEMPLETLLDVLERLAGDNTITIRSYRTISKTRRYAAWINEQTPEDVCSTYKAAVVAAICQLIGLEVEE